MGHTVHTYRKLAVGLLAATGVVGLTARAILAQSNPPGPAASTQDEPIKRTVLFRGDLEGAPGKEIVVFVADLAPGAVGRSTIIPDRNFFTCSKVRWPMSRKAVRSHDENGGVRLQSEQGNSPHQEPEHDRAGAGYRFPYCGERPADRHSSQVAPTPQGAPAISASGPQPKRLRHAVTSAGG